MVALTAMTPCVQRKACSLCSSNKRSAMRLGSQNTALLCEIKWTHKLPYMYTTKFSSNFPEVNAWYQPSGMVDSDSEHVEQKIRAAKLKKNAMLTWFWTYACTSDKFEWSITHVCQRGSFVMFPLLAAPLLLYQPQGDKAWCPDWCGCIVFVDRSPRSCDASSSIAHVQKHHIHVSQMRLNMSRIVG